MSTASEPESAAEEFASCAVCGRTILRGERLHDYVDAEGETVGVCALCKSHAEASGWIPAAHAGTVSRHAIGRRRRGARLRERLGRRSQTLRAEDPEASSSETVSQPPVAPPPAVAPGPPPAPPTPLEVFNESAEPRTIAGLMRSLGEPRASVRSDADGELVTVAWELSWYQWRVSDGEVREVAKGGELGELAAEDREWNASPASDGQLVLD